VKRRRLILLAVAFAVGTAWWCWPDGLSSEEQQIVGRWRYCCPPNSFWPKGATYVFDYRPDRTYRCQAIDGQTGLGVIRIHGRWQVPDRNLVVTWDQGIVDNFRRVLPTGVPGALPRNRYASQIEQLSATEMVLRNQLGHVDRRTRISPDDRFFVQPVD
jgi:hypothetical protein